MRPCSTVLKECKFIFTTCRLFEIQADHDDYSMIILAALCLIPAHPGFIFKNNETLKRDSQVEEPKLVQEA
jgi:hypothetical protein